MAENRFPQAEQMAHESMERNLREQALAIWPQEAALYDGYGLAAGTKVLDVGCGTGEIAARLAQRYPGCHITGVDLLDQHLHVAGGRYADLAAQLSFAVGDAYALAFADNTFELCINRHMLQSVPDPQLIIAELVRVTRPGGHIHLLVEDYGMIHGPAVDANIDRLWHAGVLPYGEATGTDLRIGRHVYRLLHDLPLQDIRLDYITVDTLRADRAAFAGIMTAWRDGYAGAIAQHSGLSIEEVTTLFDALIAAIKDKREYVCWQVPIASAQKV